MTIRGITLFGNLNCTECSKFQYHSAFPSPLQYTPTNSQPSLSYRIWIFLYTLSHWWHHRFWCFACTFTYHLQKFNNKNSLMTFFHVSNQWVYGKKDAFFGTTSIQLKMNFQNNTPYHMSISNRKTRVTLIFLKNSLSFKRSENFIQEVWLHVNSCVSCKPMLQILLVLIH